MPVSSLWVLALMLMTSFCSAASAATNQSIRVGDERLSVVLSWDSRGFSERECDVEGKPVAADLRAVPWAARLEGKWLTPEQDRVTLVESDSASLARRVLLAGEGPRFTWTLEYRRTGPGRITKFLELTPRSDGVLEHVALWQGRAAEQPRIASTQWVDIAAFYRDADRGLFVSLDFPYSRIQCANGMTSVWYPPYEPLKSGRPYTAHSLTIGATRLTGKERYGWDAGEVEAMDAYVQERFPPRFERPLFTAGCIVNRYTYCQRNVIWYTYKDHPTLSFNTELLKRDIAAMARLGMEYYQLFPGYFDWGPDDPRPEFVREIMRLVRRHGMRAGDYSAPNGLFCGHYNDYSNTLDRPEWEREEEPGRKVRGLFCLGEPAYVDYYTKRAVANCKKFGFEVQALDFMSVWPCYAKSHPHPPGDESIYHQTKGLVRVLEAFNAVSPEMMTWPNSGSWQEFLPKLAWYAPNLYLTDPGIMTPWQGLNMTRLLDDARREQMVGLHYSRFVPYRFFTNFQYFFSQNSVVPDIRSYQYGALSTIAVTPNLGLGEIRPWLDRLPAPQQEEVIAFYEKWTDFLKKNFDLWKKTCHAGDSPGSGGVEIYAHAAGRRGFVFVVNPQYWDRVVEVPLDGELGFAEEGTCEMVERYPTERLCLTPQGPFPRLGTRLPVLAPAQQVRVFEIRPAPASIKRPRLYGLPGSVEKTKTGYLVKTRGQQGSAARFAVLAPSGNAAITSASVRADVPKQPQRDFYETALRFLGANEQGALFDVRFRRTPPPTELREWRVEPGELQSGLAAQWNAALPQGETTRFPLFVNTTSPTLSLPLDDAQTRRWGLGPLVNFCGAYVDNAFGETQETWIELQTSGKPKALRTPLAQTPEAGPPALLSPTARSAAMQWWFQTRFHLPFMYMLGAEPGFDEHTILVLPFLRPEAVDKIEGWINGAPLNIQCYRYPRNRALFCYWADLVGSDARSGENTLVLHLEFKQ